MRPHSRTEPCLLPYGLGVCTWAQFESECKVCSMPFDVGPPEDRRSGGYNDRLPRARTRTRTRRKTSTFRHGGKTAPAPWTQECV